jgi:hypothetical protein
MNYRWIHLTGRLGVLVPTLATTVASADTKATQPIPSQPPTAPPGYWLSRSGAIDDFDFLAGAWTTVQRRLKTRGVGSTEWKDRDHARWEQAFSFDNQSWETNWTTDFTRTQQVIPCGITHQEDAPEGH